MTLGCTEVPEFEVRIIWSEWFDDTLHISANVASCQYFQAILQIVIKLSTHAYDTDTVVHMSLT